MKKKQKHNNSLYTSWGRLSSHLMFTLLLLLSSTVTTTQGFLLLTTATTRKGGISTYTTLPQMHGIRSWNNRRQNERSARTIQRDISKNKDIPSGKTEEEERGNMPSIVQQTSRRSILQNAAAAVMLTGSGITNIPTMAAAAATDAPSTTKTSYFQQFPTLFDPIYGSSNRKTILRQVDTNIWCLEQNLSLGPLETPLRCVVIKLSDGSLWVHAPLAPTEEFFELVESLADAGKTNSDAIKHVVIPTYALEHKIFAKDALKRWTNAKLWVAPNQFNFPLKNVSNEFVWGRTNVDGVLYSSDEKQENTQQQPQPPWIDEIAYETLVAGTFQIGTTKQQPFCETTFYHKATKTLIVTDALAKIQATPPPLSTPEKILLISKRSTSDPMPEDTAEARQIGWEKNALLISYFFPEHEEPDPDKAGVVTWTPGWHDNFLNLSQRKVFVPPVVRTLLYAQDPSKVQNWVDRVTSRFDDVQKIIPAHWEGPIVASKDDIKNAFLFLKDDSYDAFPEEDLKRGLKFVADLVYGKK